MRKAITICVLVVLGALPALVFVHGIRWRSASIDKYDAIDRPARIYPDYSSTVIPPKIAPLNFTVQEKGLSYLAKIYSEKGEAIEISSRSGKILIPENSWHKLLETNRGGELHFDIFVRTENRKWNRFSTITSKIANDDMDNFLVYRRMHPTYLQTRGRVGIFQRDLRNFDEKVVIDNSHYRDSSGCFNCHTFCGNSPEKVLIGVRTNVEKDSTLLIEGDTVKKLGAKFGYTTWHPSGRVAAYAIINQLLFFHTANNEMRDAIERDSLIVYYIFDNKAVTTSPGISRKDYLETWPTWSADGKYLYFCSALMPWPQHTEVLPPDYNELKYDLSRISYDVESDKWGEVETVVSAKNTGLSVAMPRTSPDGRWLIFCMSEYGSFAPFQPSSDLYMIDLKSAGETGLYEYKRLEINSDKSEAWHCWSSNSRWIVFSSKRDNDIFTRSYISYVDETGKVSKPLVIPQKDPEYYDYCLEMFTTPELITGPLKITGQRLARVIRNSAPTGVNMPTAITMATPRVDGVSEKGRE